MNTLSIQVSRAVCKNLGQHLTWGIFYNLDSDFGTWSSVESLDVHVVVVVVLFFLISLGF